MKETIIGIIIGWSLNEISNYFRIRIKTKIKANKCLFYLLIYYEKLVDILRSFNHAARLHNSAKLIEEERKRIADKFIFDPKNLLINREEIEILFSEIDPLLALEANKICTIITDYQKLKLENISKTKKEELYLNHLLTLETILNELEKKLQKFMLKLAWKINIKN